MNFSDYQAMARETAIYPRQYSIVYPSLGLAGEAGEVCNKVKKIFRDQGGLVEALKSGNLDRLSDELGDVLWYVAAIASDLGLDLGSIAEANVAKLRDRRDRGALKGEGDKR